jgi:hypothetical protein
LLEEDPEEGIMEVMLKEEEAELEAWQQAPPPYHQDHMQLQLAMEVRLSLAGATMDKIVHLVQ